MSQKKATGTRPRRVMSVDADWVQKRMRRSHEWITMDDGTEVCVWSTTVGDTLQILQAATRPGAFADLGPDEAMATRTQIALAVHNGEPPEGERIFGDDRLPMVDLLSPQEMNRILITAARLNGMDGPALERLRAFMTRNGGEPPQT